ncbi:MAG TPA: hypothetical protein VJ867_15880 [Gemmatimonadaceae bacterium]|nr:hypothetical protein [Gemmatimonadaceae bacterium]
MHLTGFSVMAQVAATPAAPATPVPPGEAAAQTQAIAGASPRQMYEAYRNQRSELSDQLERLQDQRNDISNSLAGDQITATDRKGLEQRLQAVDQRIASTEAQMAIADANVARAAAVPGAIVHEQPPIRQGPPDEVYVLTGIFMFVVLFPLSIAYARRIWRRSVQVVSQIPQDIYDRFSKLDQSVDAIAIEVERIGEGQRYLTKLYADQRSLGPGAAQPVELPVREREGQTRK